MESAWSLLAPVLTGLTGAFAGLVPAGLKLWRNRQEHRQELELLKVQAGIQEKLGTTRLEESRIQGATSDYKIAMQHEISVGKNLSTWAFNIRGLMRPGLTAYIWIMTTILLAYCFVYEVEGIDLMEVVRFLLAAANTALHFWFTNKAANAAVLLK